MDVETDPVVSVGSSDEQRALEEEVVDSRESLGLAPIQEIWSHDSPVIEYPSLFELPPATSQTPLTTVPFEADMPSDLQPAEGCHICARYTGLEVSSCPQTSAVEIQQFVATPVEIYGTPWLYCHQILSDQLTIPETLEGVVAVYPLELQSVYQSAMFLSNSCR